MQDDKLDNPLERSAAHEERIRVRAYYLWTHDGCPEGRGAEYWERAVELDALATYSPAPLPKASEEPVIEQAALEENLGEFPTSFGDRGDRMATPESREIAKAFRDGER
jgi:hypothetical protein